MIFRNADHLEQNETLQTDICIVGGGAAGISLALELEKSRFRVMLLESGDIAPLDAADKLDTLEIAGYPLNTKARVRRRCLGGTTVSTYGRSVILDKIDFEDRPWVTDNPWPVAEAELRPWYPQAARILGLSHPRLLHAEHWAEHPVARASKSRNLAVRIHRWGKHINLGCAWAGDLRKSKQVEIILRATVVSCQSETEKTRVRQLAVRGLNGGHFTVRARAFVLACGGLENARLLLLSQRENAAPAINWEPVGRYYMNHPRTEQTASLRLNPLHPRWRDCVRLLVMHRDRRVKGRLQFGFSPSENLQRSEGLLNVSSFFYAVSDEKARAARNALLQVKDSWARKQTKLFSALGQLGRHVPLLASGALHQMQLKPFRPDHLVVVDQCEQPPDPESRVLLGEARDPFGSPLLKLDWRIAPATTDSLRRLHGLMAPAFSSLGLGQFESRLLDDPHWVPDYGDCAHPTGATRMSQSDRKGVVDSQCQVHGLHNLFVVGSSVFPVGGHANPTFNIIALAVRLASLLKKELPETPGQF